MLGTKDTTVALSDGLGCVSTGRRHPKITSATQADTVGDRGWSGAEMVMDRVTVAEAADRLASVIRDAVRKCIKRGSIEWKGKP